MRVARLPKPGETVVGYDYAAVPGGKGSNQAIAARRLGARVNFVGRIGEDERGDAAVELWKAEGVDADLVGRSRTPTGLGFVMVDGDGANAIAIDPGANGEVGPEDLGRADSVLSASGLVLLQLEIPHLTMEAAAKRAREHGAKVILNPAPGMRADELRLEDVDIITPNEEEFSVLTGTADLDSGARALLALGPKGVVVTLGARGARVVTSGDSYTVPAPAVRVVDTTGAGDAFNGALAVALSEGEPLRQAVRFANCAGALSVSKPEVVASLPRRAEVDEFIRNDVLE
ncbi:MAG: ribokinase [Nitrososphaerota archaeon]|nr:ribokinase [Nitrososphaerota archaeon]MDG7010746.1 ribokinase [Nitrososphaerota archaeon]